MEQRKHRPPVRPSRRFLRRGGLLVLLVVLSLAMLGCEDESFFMYTKGAELWIHHTGEGSNPKKITEHFVPNKDAFNPTNNEHGSITVNELTDVDEHSLRIVYPTALEGKIYSLMYKDNGLLGSPEELIDSNIESHKTNADVTRVVYRLADPLDLYRYDLDKSYLLAKNVQSYFTTEETADVCYLVGNGTLYFQSGDQDPETIDQNVDELYGIDCNSAIYYRKSDMLYIKKAGAESPEYLSSHVKAVVIEADNGSCHILCGNYEAAETAFEAGVIPEGFALPNDMSQIIFYDGSQQYPLAPLAQNDLSLEDMTGRGKVCYTGYDPSSARKITAQDVKAYQLEQHCTGEEAIQALWDTWLRDNRRCFLAVREKVVWSRLADPGFTPCLESGEGVFFYSIATANGTRLYRVDLSGEHPPDTMLHANIQADTLRLFAGGTIPVYLTDVRQANVGQSVGWVGSLWMDQQQVAVDAYSNRILYNESQSALMYMSAYDLNTQSGTLMRFSNGDRERISDQVYYYTLSTGGDLVYLKHYDLLHNKGELWLDRTPSDIQLDTDVANLMLLN